MKVPGGARKWIAAAIVLLGTAAVVQLSLVVSPGSWAPFPLGPSTLDGADAAGLLAWMLPSPLPIVWIGAIVLWVLVLLGAVLADEKSPSELHRARRIARERLAKVRGERLRPILQTSLENGVDLEIAV